MASYQGHLTFASLLGASYGGVAAWQWQMDWGPVALQHLLIISGMLFLVRFHQEASAGLKIPSWPDLAFAFFLLAAADLVFEGP